jgi:uncharacterized membrane protein YhaH (DUF805 family)
MRVGRVGFVLGNVPLLAAAYWHDSLGAHLFHNAPPELAGKFILVGYVIGAVFLTVLRCHDFNQTLWNNFWTEQIPVIGQFWALAELLFKPGTEGHNSFGPQPFI